MGTFYSMRAWALVARAKERAFHFTWLDILITWTHFSSVCNVFSFFFPFSTYGKEMSNVNEMLWVVKDVYLGMLAMYSGRWKHTPFGFSQ